MKKMIVTVVFVMSLLSGNVFAAGDDNVSRQAKETFKKEFPGAELPEWEEIKNSDVYSVRFVSDNQGFVAYINHQGSMIASARLVRNENLPYKVSQAIRKVYNDEEILKIEELAMDGTLSYFFTIEKGGTRTFLRIHHDGVVQKISEGKGKINRKRKE